jgi:hypothetical protein
LEDRAGQAMSAYPEKPFPKFINSEGVQSNPAHRHRFLTQRRKDATRGIIFLGDLASLRLGVKFPFAYLASFAVCSTATTLSELFSFCPFAQRSRFASNAGLNAATALRLERGCNRSRTFAAFQAPCLHQQCRPSLYDHENNHETLLVWLDDGVVFSV